MFISLPMRRAGQLVLVISICLLSLAAAHSQSRSLTVSVTIGDQTTTITKAVIRLNSSRGYLFGSEFQVFSGLYVTDAVFPPANVELRPTLFQWDVIKEIEIIDWQLKSNTSDTRSFCKAKLTAPDGTVRDVFLWIPEESSRYSSLSAWAIQIEGALFIDGKEQNVQIRGTQSGPTAGLRKLTFTQQ
jgi:hypothetical protein